MAAVVTNAPAEDAAVASASSNERNVGRRRVGRDAVIYGFGMVLRRAASLIMLPVYTRMLSPADYGLLQMLDMTLDVVSILMSAGMTAGVMRFYFKAQEQKERNQVVVSAAIMLVALNGLGALLLVMFAAPIQQHVLRGAGEIHYIYIAAGSFALSELLSVPMLLMRIEGRATLYSITSLVRLMTQLTLNILFLVVLKWGPVGILTSTLISNAVIGGVATIWMLRRVGVLPSLAAIKDLRRFGVPYQIATVATFILQFGDRFFLARHGLHVVGLYAFAYQFGFLLNQLATSPYLSAWDPTRYQQAQANAEDRDRESNLGLQTLTLLAVTVGLGICLFVRPALRIIADPEYLAAANLVPIVVAAFVAQAWGGVVIFGINMSEQTRYATYVMWMSAALIFCLYWLLIPPFGAYGAAIATLISFVARTALLRQYSQRLWPIRYEWRRPLQCVALAAVSVATATLLPAEGLLFEIGTASLIFAFYVLCAWRFVMSCEQRRQLGDRVDRVVMMVRRRIATA